MKNYIQLLRHATLVVRMNNVRILVDPMFSSKGTMEPVSNALSEARIPMVDLPVTNNELELILDKIDVVLVTHLHRDHWDAIAQQVINKNTPVFCQSEDDLKKIKEQGFLNVTSIDREVSFKGITISRTSGRHGTGEIENLMGKVSGFVLNDQQDAIYIAADTIWCSEVEEALLKFRPATTILNTGAAQFLSGDPITMTLEDVIKVCDTLSETAVIAVHMDTVNHCLLTRKELKVGLEKEGLSSRVYLPDDGETMIMSKFGNFTG